MMGGRQSSSFHTSSRLSLSRQLFSGSGPGSGKSRGTSCSLSAAIAFIGSSRERCRFLPHMRISLMAIHTSQVEKEQRNWNLDKLENALIKAR